MKVVYVYVCVHTYIHTYLPTQTHKANWFNFVLALHRHYSKDQGHHTSQIYITSLSCVKQTVSPFQLMYSGLLQYVVQAP